MLRLVGRRAFLVHHLRTFSTTRKQHNIHKLLIANRGEIAIRIANAAASLSIETVGIYPFDDSHSLHTKKVDQAYMISGVGTAAYLDAKQIVELAKEHNCDAIHPGYGFLSENAAFAQLCRKESMEFVGPTADQLALFGNKSSAKKLALDLGVPVLAGTEGAYASVEQAESFFKSLPSNSQVVIKALAGGGGKGMRIVSKLEDVAPLMQRCSEEALSMFGSPLVCVEQFLPRAQHIEVQILGDGRTVCHMFERECTVQRSHQKLIEIAPSPFIDDELREQLFDSALKMASHLKYKSLGTFEFLVNPNDNSFYFMETNPRLQVEHTVTEQISGLDLVAAQLHIAQGSTLVNALSLAGDGSLPKKKQRHPTIKGCLQHTLKPKGFAIQTRINMEYLSAATSAFQPSGGTIAVFETPASLGVRVDSFAYSGYKTSSQYDSLLAKLIVHSNSSNFVDAAVKTIRALSEIRIEGFPTNIPLLLTLLRLPEFQHNSNMYTRFVDDNLSMLSKLMEKKLGSPKYFTPASTAKTDVHEDPTDSSPRANDNGTNCAIYSQTQGSIIELNVTEGQCVSEGQQVAVIGAMKMEHVVLAPRAGTISGVTEHTVGGLIGDNVPLCWLDTTTTATSDQSDHHGVQDNATSIPSSLPAASVELDYVRPDLAELQDRHSLGMDKSRPEAVVRRHNSNNRTARENLGDLFDADSFVEYGGLAIAAQRLRRSFEDLLKNTPADGLVAGIGSVNGSLFPDASQCIGLSYDYMVLAGTKGIQNHRKTDRMFEIAEKLKLPVVFLCEGGGGRPGDTDSHGIAGLDCLAFALYSKLSGLVPRIGVANGRCFAGNAALLGCSDVVIATKNANIGMGGPAMIEGGGLGSFRPEEVGPAAMQARNGVVDILVDDEEEAIRVAKRYLSYFQGTLSEFVEPNQLKLRHIIPENRLRVYDIKHVVEALADEDSILELRALFGQGMITAFARIEGKPVGILANNPLHLSGAIDSDGADKASRFMQLCDAFDIPILSLIDTPGIMVGPEVEKTALVRHASRLFVTSASLSVPMMSMVLRKGYGLGAMAMAGGSFKRTLFCVSWPTGEFGGMGLEGAVTLGYKKELEAIADPMERKAAFEARVATMYEQGKAVNYATYFEIDNVIDPSASRQWVVSCLKSIPPRGDGEKKRKFIDTW